MVECEDIIFVNHGGVIGINNNQAELYAVIKALEFLRQYEIQTAVIYTDSQMVESAFNRGLIYRWMDRGWRTTTRNTLVKYRDLWEQILRKRGEMKIIFRKIKAHSGNKYNDVADKSSRKFYDKEVGVFSYDLIQIEKGEIEID